jgi:hypothetical protein
VTQEFYSYCSFVTSIGCSFKFLLRIGVEESIVNAPLFALLVFLLYKLTSDAFTIDSSMPTLRRDLNEHSIHEMLALKNVDY